jgi:hypothetical protein
MPHPSRWPFALHCIQQHPLYQQSPIPLLLLRLATNDDGPKAGIGIKVEICCCFREKKVLGPNVGWQYPHYAMYTMALWNGTQQYVVD